MILQREKITLQKHMKNSAIKPLCILFLFTSYYLANSQNQNDFEILQGFWQWNDDEDHDFFLYHEGHSKYNIYRYSSGEISVRKRHLILSRMSNDDKTIPIQLLGLDGDMYTSIFEDDIDFDLLEKYGPDSVKISLNNVLQQSYDLDESTFGLINNSGYNVFNKIDQLPTTIYQEFLKQKRKLDKEIIFDFVPLYLREGPNPLPYKIKALNEKVYFHTLPDESTRQKAFIISGDQAKVLYRKEDWYYVVFYGVKVKTSGWVRDDAVEAIYVE
ncbi:MAG: hypothetical protein AAGI25_19500 [Bacteroidota bacterium]